LLADRKIDIVLAQWWSLRSMDGVSFLEWLRTSHPETVRLLMTASIGALSQSDINRAQAFRYIQVPWRWEDLLEALSMAARTFILERRRQELLDEIMTLRSPPDPGSSTGLTIEQLLSMTSLTPDQLSSIIIWQEVQQANLEPTETTDGVQPDVPVIIEV
jgi:response regulator RpfG family c-di-GMP phosphodiesterase